MTEQIAGARSAADRILDGLSPAQAEAAVHETGPLLVIAGAGTGKTTVLTRRIAYLIATRRARPDEILALTFTDKAALEMAERVDQLIPYGYAETWIGTFHAFGDRILRESALELGLNPDFRVLTRAEQVIFLRERLWDLPLDRFRPLGDPTRHLQALLSLVSRAKDEGVTPAEYTASAESLRRRATTPAERDEAERHAELAAFFEAYQRLLAEAGLVDFGDQIGRALELLRARPAVLERLQRRYRFILVDEFQDTNHAQLELVRSVAGEGSPNVTVVGDDDQAIYRWRGAAAANLLAFRELYPSADQVVLNDNHRSTQVILDSAARLISYNNPYRLEVIAGISKRLTSEREGGRAVTHFHFDSGSAEADRVAEMVAETLTRGYRPRDVAVLVRSNDDADPFLRALNVKEVPHRFSGSRSLYAREEVRLLVSFLKTLANPSDSVAPFYLAASDIYRVRDRDLLRLNDYAGRKSRPLLDVFRGLPDNDDLKGVSGEAREALARLVRHVEEAMEDVPHRRTGEVLYRFLQACGMLASLSNPTRPENEARAKNVAKFFEAVRAYGEIVEHDRVPSFVGHLDMLREAGDDPAVAEADPNEDAVQVITVHKAKGLEFGVVFLVGCAEGRFPVQRRREPLELPLDLVRQPLVEGDAHVQEERRLFYVAMTRARDELVLTSASDYGTARPRKVSRFAVEALDLATPTPPPSRSRASEVLERFRAPPASAPVEEAVLPDGALLRLSFGRIDDYETCPLKYRYVHILRVPLLTHHRVVYGNAIHKAVQRYFRERLEGRQLALDDLLAAFRQSWVSEGFLSREHEDRRLQAGQVALERFFESDQAEPLNPTAVEKEFTFYVGRNKVVGRYDLVVEREGEIEILDFKTGLVDTQKRADRRARESLQLDLYALAHLRTTGRLPDRVALSFLETGLLGAKRPVRAETDEALRKIESVSASIRARDFAARPSYFACGQCAFRDICPYTARTGEAT